VRNKRFEIKILQLKPKVGPGFPEQGSLLKKKQN